MPVRKAHHRLIDGNLCSEFPEVWWYSFSHCSSTISLYLPNRYYLLIKKSYRISSIPGHHRRSWAAAVTWTCSCPVSVTWSLGSVYWQHVSGTSLLNGPGCVSSWYAVYITLHGCVQTIAFALQWIKYICRNIGVKGKAWLTLRLHPALETNPPLAASRWGCSQVSGYCRRNSRAARFG